MKSKIGYNCHNRMTYRRDWSAEEETYHFAHLERLQPGAMVYMDDNGRALRCKALLPDCAVVVRSHRADDGKLHETLTPQKCFDLYKDTPKGLIRYIMNEPGGYGDLRELAHWLAQVCDLYGNAGIPIAVPGFGEGHPDVDHLDYLEELWSALDKWHELHYYQTHEYGTWRGMLFNAGGTYDVFPWRIGRFETFVLPYLQKHGHKTPKVIVTEFGCDSAHDGTPKRGWTTAWSEAQYFAESMKAIEKIYSAPHYVGLCYFSWGNTGQQFTESDWSTFDLSNAKVFHSLAEDYAAKVITPTPEPLPVPLPTPSPLADKPKPIDAPAPTRQIVRSRRELLGGPGTGYRKVRDLTAGTVVWRYDTPQGYDKEAAKYYYYVEVVKGDMVEAVGWTTVEGAWESATITAEVPVVVLEPEPVKEKQYQLVIKLPPELMQFVKYFGNIQIEVVEV